jgi:2-keto-4-pentenoate hydratase/2-oxohepta-3-ene-1,7-dioic acid hydratase in catechol pathway
MVTADEIADPKQLTLVTRVNGEERQRTSTGDMIYDIPRVIEYCSSIGPLSPGDIIATGTPQGVAVHRKPPLWLKPGDVVEVEISGIGTLRNPVMSEQEWYGES